MLLPILDTQNSIETSYKMEQAIQVERDNGFRDSIDDVKSGTFRGPQHIVNAPEGLINQFLSAVDGRGVESRQSDVKRQKGEN
jgi:hypothetical protein